MASLEHSTVEHLAEGFGRGQEEIIGEWRLQAGELLRELNLDKLTITDHLPDVIAEITRDLEFGRAGALSVEHTRGSPRPTGCSVFTMAWTWAKSLRNTTSCWSH
jgi:hypothetical protein